MNRFQSADVAAYAAALEAGQFGGRKRDLSTEAFVERMDYDTKGAFATLLMLGWVRDERHRSMLFLDPPPKLRADGVSYITCAGATTTYEKWLWSGSCIDPADVVWIVTAHADAPNTWAKLAKRIGTPE